MKLVVALSALVALAAASQALYSKMERVEGSTMHSVTFMVALHSNAQDTCDSMLSQVSDPRSPKYAHYLSFSEMRMFSNPKAFKAVNAWLASRFTEAELVRAHNFEFIRVVATAERLERAFGVQLHRFVHMEAGAVAIRAAEPWSLPTALARHVDFVHGLTDFFPVSTESKVKIATSPVPEEAAVSKRQMHQGQATPQVIWATYGIKPQSLAASPAASGMVYEDGQSFSNSDVKTFLSGFSIPVASVTNVIGPNDPANCTDSQNGFDECAEADLDIQQIFSTAQKANLTFWSIPDTIQDFMFYWITEVANNPAPPLVGSVSYGSLSPEDIRYDMVRYNTEVCKLGLRGLTLFVSSGDQGAMNYQNCQQGTCGIVPSYPATCPYMTAVGGTMGPEAGNPEIACTTCAGGGITTGGGFSIVFPQPAYQSTQVQNYLQNAPGLPPTSAFNASGRGYPDVAFLANDFPIVVGGAFAAGSGTSASSPNWAALAMLANAQRLQNNKCPLGFLNTALYQMDGSNFNDITVGRNNCCEGGSSCPQAFNATVGWDPLTGLGSPKWPTLSQTLMNLPSGNCPDIMRRFAQ